MKPLPMSAMDVARPRRRRPPVNAWVAAAAVALIVAAIVAVAVVERGNEGVPVDRATIVTDVVARGTLQRSIAAAGLLVPQQVYVVSATQPGILDELYVKPGALVEAGTPIARMSNPELDAAAVAARAAVDTARAQLRSAQAQAQAAMLSEQSAYTTALAQARVDRTNLQSLQGLRRSGYLAEQTYQVAEIKATESTSNARIASAQIGVSAAEATANVAAAQALVDQAAAQLAAKEKEIDALLVRSNTPGVVQSVADDPGARIEAGTELARVADERNLKAVLQVPEAQVRDVAVGMPAQIDTGNGIAAGSVARIAPAAQDGSVAVDVAFSRTLPPGARPQLNVSGTIALETLRGVLSIARPAGAADDSVASLYRIDSGGAVARLVRVALGRGSSDRIEVRNGLAAGDTVVVSDTSAYNGAPVLRLH